MRSREHRKLLFNLPVLNLQYDIFFISDGRNFKLDQFSVILIHFRPYIFHHFRWPSQSNPLHAIHLHIYTVLNIMRIFHSGNRTRIRTRLWRIDPRLHFNFTGGILAKKEMESSSGSFTTDQPEFAPFFLYPADEDSEISAKCFH